MPRASAGSGSDFKPCPEGVTQGVLVDVANLGLIKTSFAGEEKQRRMAMLVWQVDERRDDGKRYLIFQRVGLSLHQKATLRKIVDALLPKRLTDEQAEQGIELNELIGAQGLLTLIQNESGGKIFTNVQSVAPLMKSMSKMDTEEYVRPDFLVKQAVEDGSDGNGDSEDIPF